MPEPRIFPTHGGRKRFEAQRRTGDYGKEARRRIVKIILESKLIILCGWLNNAPFRIQPAGESA